MATLPTEVHFLEQCNERCRCRTFDAADYAAFCRAVRRARRAASSGNPFYDFFNAGAVARSYGYPSTTAQWGVWVDPETLEVALTFRRTYAGGKVPCAYPGGERQYRADWERAEEARTAAHAGQPDLLNPFRFPEVGN